MSSMGDEWGNVTVARDNNGLVVVAPDTFPTAAIEQAALPAVGGTLYVNVGAQGSPPRAVLHDPYWAQTWLASVYGPEVARAVESFEELDHQETTQVVARLDYLSDVVTRLGIGFWLHRWWPAGARDIPDIDDRLLEIEIGALAWFAEALFIDTAPTVQLLEPHADLLAGQVRAVREGGTGDEAHRELGVLKMALRATTDLVDDSTVGYAECEALLIAIESEDRAVTEASLAIDWAGVVSEIWDRFMEALPASAPALSTRGDRGPLVERTDSILRSGTTTVDELQVPPRTVLAREGNVQWTLTDGGRTDPLLVVQVAVPPGVASPGAAMLLARAYTDEVPRIFRLPYDERLRAYVGSHPLGALTIDPVIDVFATAFVLPPRLGAEGLSQIRQDRESIARIILDRRGAASGPAGHFIAERVAWDD